MTLTRTSFPAYTHPAHICSDQGLLVDLSHVPIYFEGVDVQRFDANLSYCCATLQVVHSVMPRLAARRLFQLSLSSYGLSITRLRTTPHGNTKPVLTLPGHPCQIVAFIFAFYQFKPRIRLTALGWLTIAFTTMKLKYIAASAIADLPHNTHHRSTRSHLLLAIAS